MKNNFFKISLLLLLNFVFYNSANSNELTFESNTIEITNNGDVIQASNGVEVQGINNIKITAENSIFNNLTSELLIKDDVIFYDSLKDIQIKSNEILYNRKIEKIISNGKTYIELANDYKIITNNIEYLKNENTIQSKFKTILIDKFNNQISVKDFVYLTDKKLFHGNDIIMLDADENNYLFENTIIDLNNRTLLAKDVEINFNKNIFGNSNNDPRLRGASLSLNKNETIVKKGIFTSCKKNDDCPPWSLQSSEIKHDKVKKTINYKNAWLKIYDKPIIYFPKFFHPDPTVERQSGFLMPSLVNSSTIGNSLGIPYFAAISENKDLTITPRFYTKGDFMIQNEFRQVEKNYQNILDFSFKNMKGGNKSHFFSNSFINFEDSNLEINFEATSHDTYLKTDNIKTQRNFSPSIMNNYFNFDMSKENLDIAIEFKAYEDLSLTNSSDKFEYVYPNFSINKTLSTQFDYLGNFDYQVSGFQRKYETNKTEQLIVNDFIFSTSIPLVKETDNYIKEFIPKLSLFLSPNKSDNITTLDRKINNTNIFSTNRLGLADSLEGGQSLTLGTEYNLNKSDGSNIFQIDLAQIYRANSDTNLPTKTSMNNKVSNLFGDFKLNANQYLDIEYNFALDDNFKTLNYNMIKSTFSINNFVTSFEFMEENNIMGSNSYLSNETSLALDNNSKILFRERRNKETDLKEFYNIIYQYENDCLVASLEYNKDYYTDRDLKPNEEIFFSLTIIPFGSLNIPSFSK